MLLKVSLRFGVARQLVCSLEPGYTLIEGRRARIFLRLVLFSAPVSAINSRDCDLWLFAVVVGR